MHQLSCVNKVPTEVSWIVVYTNHSTLFSCGFISGGKELISEETVEAVDKENQSFTYAIFEGDLMKMYKTLKITFQNMERIS